MNKFLLALGFFCFFAVNSNGQTTEVYTDSLGVEHIEVYPEFPGGDEAMHHYLDSVMIYPEEARIKNITGKVMVSFIVEIDGSVSTVRIEKGIAGGCNEEAVRVIRKMPKWKPATRDGVPIRVKYNFPINFALK